MSYINQNNQGARPYQNKSEYGANGSNYRGIYPVQANEDYSSYQNSSSYNNRGHQGNCGSNQGNCNCNQPTPCPTQPCQPQPCPSKPCNCNQHECECNKPKPCSCTKECECECEKPTPKPDECDDTCTPANNCCKGQKCTFDSKKCTCVCTLMDVIFDEEIACGPTVFQLISATVPNFIITSEFTQSGQCCTACVVDSTSVFTVDNVKTTIKSFILQNPASITTGNILIGGKPALSVTPNNGGFDATVDPTVLNATCTCKEKGTNSNVLITGLANWNYIARYEFCGKVTTGGTTCSFKITAENSPTVPGTIPDALTFVASDICLPESTGSEAVRIKINFIGKGQLVNPVITAAGGPPPLPVTITAGGNLMLTTQAELTVVKNEKVCIQGMVQ